MIEEKQPEKVKEWVSKEGICLVCTKNNGYFQEGCDVLRERIGEVDDGCFAYTNDKKWEKQVNTAVKSYATEKGLPDYVPIVTGDHVDY